MTGLRLETGAWATLGGEAARVRAEVFVREQGIAAEQELDARDAECVHCVAWLGPEPVATGRLLPDGHVGRMAVLAPHRGRGLGRQVLRALLDAAALRGDAEVVLDAQAPAIGFYAREGFAAEGEPFVEVGIEHRRMRRRLFGDPRDRTEAMADGVGLRVRDWGEGRGPGVYLLHGLGEHVARHDPLARWLSLRGWRVRGHDHVGHGGSAGRRGVLAHERQLIEHASALVGRFAEELGAPPVLLGHSMGGALAAQLVACERLPVRGLVLSSPALDTGIGPAQRALGALLFRLAPDLAVGNGLDPQALSHDPEVVRRYRQDPLVHDRISARLLRWLVSAGEQARQAAGTLAVPTLLQVAGADRLVSPEGSRVFARAAPENLLTLRWYDRLFHEIYNEQATDRRPVLADLDDWLRRLSPA